jgi:uncharacterized membrane protein YfcA
MMFTVFVAIVAIIGGGMTAIAGAGTGSTLVPLFAQRLDFKLAVAAVALPHLAASASRAVRLRRAIDGKLFVRFGVVCAIASLVGALIHTHASSPIITYLFAALLVLAGLLGLTGWSERIRLGKKGAFIAGGLSGFLGGFAGEQGGIRAVALLGFDLKKEAFVATGTAVAVLIDVVRAPVYMVAQWDALKPVWGFVALAVSGVSIGTFVGGAVFQRIPEQRFSRIGVRSHPRDRRTPAPPGTRGTVNRQVQ